MGLTWRCHVCKEERPDEKISVFKGVVLLGTQRIPVDQNVRYCNDRPGCIDGAPSVNFLKGERPVRQEEEVYRRDPLVLEGQVQRVPHPGGPSHLEVDGELLSGLLTEHFGPWQTRSFGDVLPGDSYRITVERVDGERQRR